MTRSSNLKPQRPVKKDTFFRRKNYRRRDKADAPRYWPWAVFFSFGLVALAGLGLGLALLYYQILTCGWFSIKDTKNIDITGLKRLQLPYFFPPALLCL